MVADEPAEEWFIERLGKHHNRTAFHCGQPLLDEWLKQRSSQYDRRDLARTYVAVQWRDETEQADVVVRGYYSLSNHRVSYHALTDDGSKGLPRMDVPVILLGRLAVDRTFQRCGLGSCLLIDALRRCQSIAEQIGVRAVEVHAIDQAASNFYRRFGFIELLDDPQHLYLPMQRIRKLRLPPMK